MELENQHLAIRRVITGFKKIISGYKLTEQSMMKNRTLKHSPRCINYKGTESNSTVEKHAERGDRLMNVSITRNR